MASDAKAQVVAELEIMREDVRTLELALAKVSKQMKTETDPFGGTQHKASTALGALELADAAQAATDTRGWKGRLEALLVKYEKRSVAGAAADRVLPESMLHEMRALLAHIETLLGRWTLVQPVERRGKQRFQTSEKPKTAAAVMEAGHLEGITLPSLTPRGSHQAKTLSLTGAPVATPRNPQLFLHNPKLLTARGPLAVPPEIASQLSARGGHSARGTARGGQQSTRSGAGVPMHVLGKSKGPSPLGPGDVSQRLGSSKEDKKHVPSLSLMNEPMPHLDLAVPSMRSDRSARGGSTTAATKASTLGSMSDRGGFFDTQHSLSYLDLALPDQMDMSMYPDFFGGSFMDDSFLLDSNDSLSFDQQLAELSGLLGGDLNAPQFLQEMLMLQMQVR